MSRAGLQLAGSTEHAARAGDQKDRPPACASGEGVRASRGGIREALLEQIDALYRFILVRVGFDEQLAEELLQRTAEAALRADGAPREIGSVEAWLRGVARNMVRRHWRDRARGNGHAPIDGAGPETLAALESECPREALEGRERHRALLRAIASLASDEQRLLYDFYKHGRSTARIADDLGCSPKGVEMRLYRVRARLREALADGGDD